MFSLVSLHPRREDACFRIPASIKPCLYGRFGYWRYSNPLNEQLRHSIDCERAVATFVAMLLAVVSPSAVVGAVPLVVVDPFDSPLGPSSRCTARRLRTH